MDSCSTVSSCMMCVSINNCTWPSEDCSGYTIPVGGDQRHINMHVMLISDRIWELLEHWPEDPGLGGGAQNGCNREESIPNNVQIIPNNAQRVGRVVCNIQSLGC